MASRFIKIYTTSNENKYINTSHIITIVSSKDGDKTFVYLTDGTCLHTLISAEELYESANR